MLLLCLLSLSIALHVLLVCFLLLTVYIHSAPIAASLFNKFIVSVSVRGRWTPSILHGSCMQNHGGTYTSYKVNDGGRSSPLESARTPSLTNFVGGEGQIMGSRFCDHTRRYDDGERQSLVVVCGVFTDAGPIGPIIVLLLLVKNTRGPNFRIYSKSGGRQRLASTSVVTLQHA